MKQLEVFRKIGSIIKELNEQYEYIESNPEHINDLELELFVANAHFLTDHAEILNKLNQRNKAENAHVKPPERLTQQLAPTPATVAKQPQPPAPVIIPEPAPKPLPKNAEQVERALEKIKSLTAEKFFEPVVQQPKRDATRDTAPEEAKAEESTPKIDLTTESPKDSYSFELDPPPIIRHELVVDESADLDEDEELPYEEMKEVNEAPAVEVAKAKEDTEERIAIEIGKTPGAEPAKAELNQEEPVKEKDEVFTINQRISAQLGNSNNVAEQASHQPVTNLKQAITLNDKLLFIKDLFNGYSLAYSEAIEILNRFNTFEEANRFLNKNYTTKNNWDSKPETTDRFFALLKRRYS
jgi:hypothetical protein